MQRHLILTVCFLLRGALVISQDSIYVLHPVIGAIIDRNEKVEYLLFRDADDSTFNYGYIKYTEGNYCLNFYLAGDSFVARPIDTTEIQQYKINIEKLRAYYTFLQEKDSAGGSENEIKMMGSEAEGPYQIKNVLLDSYTIEMISDEARKNERLKRDAELEGLWKQGSNADNAGNYIDIDLRRKRRK